MQSLFKFINSLKLKYFKVLLQDLYKRFIGTILFETRNNIDQTKMVKSVLAKVHSKAFDMEKEKVF